MEIVNKIKILFIVTQSEFGGAQRYVFEVARNLDKERYEVLVAAGRGDGELFRKLRNINIRSIYLKQMKRAPWPWQIILAIKEIAKLLKKEKPNVLFLCSTTAGLLGSIAGFFCGNLVSKNETKFRVIYRIGGWAFRDPRAFWKNWLILLAEKLTAPLKDKIIVNAEIDKKLALKYKIAPANKLIKIYNGIDINSLSFLSREEARSKFGFEQSTKVVGTVANFYKTKGLEYLIEATAQLSEASPQSISPRSIFVIIGEGKLRPKLEALIKKYGLENKVLLVGRVPDAYKYLKAFDVFVLPSLKEGFPWIILEAMAAEIPIVATKTGAIPEIIEKESLVEIKNSQQIAEKINWLLQQPKEAESLVLQAKEKVKREFTLQKMVSETEKLLN